VWSAIYLVHTNYALSLKMLDL